MPTPFSTSLANAFNAPPLDKPFSTSALDAFLQAQRDKPFIQAPPPAAPDIGVVERNASRFAMGGISNLRQGLNRSRLIRSDNPIAQAEADARRLSAFSSGLTRTVGAARGAATNLEQSRVANITHANDLAFNQQVQRENLLAQREFNTLVAEAKLRQEQDRFNQEFALRQQQAQSNQQQVDFNQNQVQGAPRGLSRGGVSPLERAQARLNATIGSPAGSGFGSGGTPLARAQTRLDNTIGTPTQDFLNAPV